MRTTGRTHCLKWFICLLFILSIPSLSQADTGDFLSKFSPYITLEEEYSDNIYLTSKNRKSRLHYHHLPGTEVFDFTEIRENRPIPARFQFYRYKIWC